MGSVEEEDSLRVIDLMKEAVRASLRGDGEEWKNGLVFGKVQPGEVTLIGLGIHGCNSVFINSHVHWIFCEIWSKRFSVQEP